MYLYEIRDALSARFANKKTALKQLDISNKEWGVLGDLANNQPLIQGRHRGKVVEMLCSAQSHELDTARKIVVIWVEKYLRFLENQYDR